MLTSNSSVELEVGDRRSWRGKHAKSDVRGDAGVPDGERRYVDVRGEISGYLRAVFWFAG